MTIHIISFMNCTLILNSNNDHLEKSFCLIISVAMNASSMYILNPENTHTCCIEVNKNTLVHNAWITIHSQEMSLKKADVSHWGVWIYVFVCIYWPLLYLCASTHLFLSYPKSEKEGLHVAFFFLKHSATYVIYSFTVFLLTSMWRVIE